MVIAEFSFILSCTFGIIQDNTWTKSCVHTFIISMDNSISSHMQSVHCLRNGLRAILYRKIRKIHPPFPLSSPPPQKKIPTTKSQLPQEINGKDSIIISSILMKSLVISAIWLALNSMMYSRITIFCYKSHLF